MILQIIDSKGQKKQIGQSEIVFGVYILMNVVSDTLTAYGLLDGWAEDEVIVKEKMRACVDVASILMLG